MKGTAHGTFLPYFWTNRLWGGVVPWLYINDTSFLTEEKAPGGEWLWKQFYPNETPARRRLPVARTPTRSTTRRVEESSSTCERMVERRTRVEPGAGRRRASWWRSSLQARIGMTPGRRLLGAGSERGRDGGNDEFDVTFFPRWRGQRHQFGAAGYAIMRTSPRKDEAWEWIKFCVSARPWMSIPAHSHAGPALPRWSTTALRRRPRPGALAGLLRHARQVPRPPARSRRRRSRPPSRRR